MIKTLFMLCLWTTPALAADSTTASLEASKALEASTPLEQAKQDMQAGRYAQALDTLSELVKKEDNNYEAWFLFGVAQVHEQKDHQAIEAFRHVIELRPTLAEPHNNLAAVYNNLGDTKAAIHELEIALEKRPNYTVAEENLADLHIKLALQYYRDSLKHGANSIIEQRYARLLRVRNPVAADNQAAQPQQPRNKKGKPATATEPVMIPQPYVGKASKPIVTPKPSTAQKSMPSIAEDKSITGVLDALEAWRTAWSTQALDAYFKAYATDFKPESRFNSIAAWKAYKTRVIQNKAFIDVQLEKVEVDIPASRDIATIHVLQHFRSNTYVGDDYKTITMKYTPQGWKIISEASAP
jgi:Flp pilus assembly protein TadD